MRDATENSPNNEELHSPLLEENGFGLEHHLHRGRALAAFNQIIGQRVQNLKSEWEGTSSSLGQTNIQLDVQKFLSPLGQHEDTILSSVLSTTILHFEVSMLVASCAFLLELCDLSAGKMRIDNVGSVFHAKSHESDVTESLARALSDEYLHKDSPVIASEVGAPSKQSSRALILVLHHLEKASLPLLVDGNTYGSWILTRNGDGNELRSHRKISSQHWSFAQIGGYPYDTVVQVASKEFSNPHLRLHMLTVLRGMQSKKKVGSAPFSDTLEKSSETPFLEENICVPVELFQILAVFWLEITAARETSSIKVNDIASQIADNIGAVVAATNALPLSDRVLTFHYNRQSPKRR
ncbi:hypothetical protein KIW84_041698 [Lathyrus oleraceus]|uniref:Uncharacterized protein n=1 Tax=Pisum sativum TaxID=3888 RepID=A0A9D4X998_PEA|nr:hypothetical protein KIW84_041698 [Pisum sativum]